MKLLVKHLDKNVNHTQGNEYQIGTNTNLLFFCHNTSGFLRDRFAGADALRAIDFYNNSN